MRGRTVFAVLVGLVVTAVKGFVPTRRQTSTSFAGSNEYFLHALSASEQKTYIETLAGWGAKVIRLWGEQSPDDLSHNDTTSMYNQNLLQSLDEYLHRQTGGNSESDANDRCIVTNIDEGCLKGSTITNSMPPLETSVGVFDTTVLAALDATLKLLHDNGMKAIISPHNANSLTGDVACDAYCQKYTDASTFYSSTEAKADYDKRLEKILNYQSPNFGEAWKSLNQVIMAFDLQNEPLIKQLDKLNNNDPDDWLCGRAGVMRNALGSSNIKIATGGIGGSHYCCDHEFNTLEKAMQCDAIDIISMHGYMSKASDWAYYITGDKEVLSGARAAGKNIMMEEWGVSTDFQDSFDTQAQIFNDAGVPWVSMRAVHIRKKAC
jgi:mannan endo-1,4-beta-mannosidase